MGRRKSSRVAVVVDGVEVGSLYLRHHRWWFDHRANGNRRFLNLRTADLEEALRKAKAEAARNPVIPVSDVSAILAKPKNLEEALERYEEEYGKEFKKTSLARIRQTVRPFVAFIGPHRPTYVINRAYMKAWRKCLADRFAKGEITAATANGEIRRTKAFVNWLRQEELVDGNPTFKIRRFKEHSVALEAPAHSKVEVALERFKGSWLHDFVVVLANTGLRPSEALHLRACDVDIEKRLLHIRTWGDWTVKDYEFRKLLMNETAYEVLLRLKMAAPTSEALLFPNSKGKPYEYHNFKTQHWSRVLGRKPLIAPYDLRHYFATAAALAGWPIEKLSAYLGHANLATTRKYYADLRALSEIGAPPITTGGDQMISKGPVSGKAENPKKKDDGSMTGQ